MCCLAETVVAVKVKSQVTLTWVTSVDRIPMTRELNSFPPTATSLFRVCMQHMSSLKSLLHVKYCPNSLAIKAYFDASLKCLLVFS